MGTAQTKKSSLFWIQAWPAHLLLDLGMAPGEGAYWTTKINLKNKYHQNKIIENYTNEHNQNKSATSKKNIKQLTKTMN